MVENNGAARGQRHRSRVRILDLVLDLEAREKRNIVAVELDAAHVLRHHMPHELLRLLAHALGVDQNLADILVEIIPDGPDHQARFLVDEESAALLLRGVLDRAPELQQVVKVPAKLLGAAADGRRAADDAHALGHRELIDHITQLVSIFALHAARDAAAARIVRHQDQVAPRETDKGRKRRALIAAFILVYLDDELLTFLESILDSGATHVHAAPEVGPRDFLEGKEPMALGAIVHKRCFQAGFDAGNDPLVDVALALFLGGGFDVEVDELLAIDNRDAQLFGLRRVKQHAFHYRLLPRSTTRDGQTSPTALGRGADQINGVAGACGTSVIRMSRAVCQFLNPAPGPNSEICISALSA